MLNIMLRRAGLVTGPLRSGHTSHSSLEVIKKYLLGYPQLSKKEYFLLFGSALHEVFLQGIRNNYYKRITKEDKKLVDAMVKKLNENPVVVSLMQNSHREHRFSVKLNGVKVVVILDSKQLKLLRGFDLKTTNCTTQRDFEESIRTLGYVRQGLTYRLAARLKFFYFVGINKKPPHPIFIADLGGNKFTTDLLYAEQELKFLLYFFKNYGKIKTKKNEKENSLNGKIKENRKN